MGSITILGYAGYTEHLIEKDLSWSADDNTGPELIGVALRSGEVQVDNDLEFRASHSAEMQPALRTTFASMIAIPLTGDLRPPSVLTIHSWDPQAFDGPAVALLTEMAGDLGFGIAKHRDAVRLEVALDGTLAVIARMTETRDPYTAGHQERVGVLSAAIAERLGLTPAEIEGVRRGAQVHDVGKIAIAAEIRRAQASSTISSSPSSSAIALWGRTFCGARTCRGLSPRSPSSTTNVSTARDTRPACGETRSACPHASSRWRTSSRRWRTIAPTAPPRYRCGPRGSDDACGSEVRRGRRRCVPGRVRSRVHVHRR